jgi:hypothetical protein
MSFVQFPIKPLKALFLYTKSDIKTILIPVVCNVSCFLTPTYDTATLQTIFSVATVPLHDRTHLPQLMLWV